MISLSVGRVRTLGKRMVRWFGEKPIPPKPSHAPKSAREPSSFEKALNDPDLGGWKPFKMPVKKTIRHDHKQKYAPLAHPWLYKYSKLKTRPQRDRNPWALSEDELNELRGKAYVKPPLPERKPSNKQLMLQLRKEETMKIAKEWPRHIEPFRAGDKLKITKHLTLDRDNKFEVVKGFCIGRSNRNLESYFRIINYKTDVVYEMNIPLWSPFIKSIEVIEKGNFKRSKLYYMKERPWQEFIVK